MKTKNYLYETKDILSKHFEIDKKGNVFRKSVGRYITGTEQNGWKQVFYCEDGQKIKTYIHRIVYILSHKRKRIPRGYSIDHLDRNKSNNKPRNLVCVTPKKNLWNTGMNKNNTSGFKGVHWHKYNKKWCAEIRNNNKSIHLGYFNDPYDAHLRYKEKCIELRAGRAVY